MTGPACKVAVRSSSDCRYPGIDPASASLMTAAVLLPTFGRVSKWRWSSSRLRSAGGVAVHRRCGPAERSCLIAFRALGFEQVRDPAQRLGGAHPFKIRGPTA